MDPELSVHATLHRIRHDHRLLVGLSGIPASGKSTLAERIVARVNALYRANAANHRPNRETTPSDQSSEQDIAILVGLDGWHLTRAQLDAMPDPKLARDRRGAHWTFDGKSYVEFVEKLHQPPSSATWISAPSFDHAIKDPTPHAVSIFPYHRLVLIEGLYTFLSIDPWRQAGEMLDERWFIDVSIEEASSRLIKRHVASGVAKDLDEAIWRAEENDMPSMSRCRMSPSHPQF